MNHQLVIVGPMLLLCLILSTAPVSAAGPNALAEARKAMEAKEFGQVDKTLAELLVREPVADEVLRLSLDAAMADGRLYTAHQRCEALLHNGGKEDPELIYLGAQLARFAGQTARETELLTLFLEKQTERSDTRQKTLLRLMEIGNDASVFARYFEEYGCRAREYRLALNMLQSLFESGDAGGYATLTESLLDNPVDDARLKAEAHEHLRKSVDAGIFMTLPVAPIDGSGEMPEPMTDNYRRYGKMLELMTTHKMLGSDFAWHCLANGDQKTPVSALRLLEKQSPLSSGELSGLRRDSLWSDQEAVPADAGRRILALEKVYRQTDDRHTYREYVYFLRDRYDLFENELTLGQAETFVRPLVEMYRDNPAEIEEAVGAVARYAKTPDELIAYYGRHKALIGPRHVSGLLEHGFDGFFGKLADHAARLAYLRKVFGDDPNALYEGHLLKYVAYAGTPADVKRHAVTVLAEVPDRVDTGKIIDLFKIEGQTAADKIAILKEAYEKTGVTTSLESIFARLKQDKIFQGDELKTFAASLDRKRLGTDKALSILGKVGFTRQKHNQIPEAKDHKLMVDALKAYGTLDDNPILHRAVAEFYARYQYRTAL